MKRILAAVMVGLLSLGACGDDDDETAATASDTARYCELVQQLDEAGETEIELDFESATPDPETVKTEFSDFVAAHGDQMDELERVAPTEITDDVKTLNATIRDVARTGDLAAFDASEEAEGRIQEFEDRECGAG